MVGRVVISIKVVTFVKKIRMEFKHIISDPAILGGKPVVKGSRISVQLILEWIASGASIEQITQKYPHLTVEGVQEAVLYASKALGSSLLIDVELGTV